jgi:hypothetical protein
VLVYCALMPLRIGKRDKPRNSGWCNLYFTIGDLMISLFTVLGDGLRPKSFPSLFGAATSVAFGTFGRQSRLTKNPMPRWLSPRFLLVLG